MICSYDFILTIQLGNKDRKLEICVSLLTTVIFNYNTLALRFLVFPCLGFF